MSSSANIQSFERIRFWRKGGAVRRWHAVHWIGREQTVGEHCFNLVGIIHIMLRERWVTDDVRPSVLILSALEHDLAEQVVGDVPRPFKTFLETMTTGDTLDALEERIRSSYGYGATGSLTKTESDWLRAADLLEAAFTIIEQFLLGNAYMSTLASHIYPEVANMTVLHRFSFYEIFRNTLREVANAEKQGRFLQAFTSWHPWECAATMAPERASGAGQEASSGTD